MRRAKNSRARALKRSPPANRPTSRWTSPALGSNSEGRPCPTKATRVSTDAIWAISPRSVRPPCSRAWRIDTIGDRCDHVHEAWILWHLNAEAAQIVGKVWPPRGERNLRQEPEGVQKCRSRPMPPGERVLLHLRGGCRNSFDFRTEPQFMDGPDSTSAISAGCLVLRGPFRLPFPSKEAAANTLGEQGHIWPPRAYLSLTRKRKDLGRGILSH